MPSKDSTNVQLLTRPYFVSTFFLFFV